jgi:hypothetical protein
MKRGVEPPLLQEAAMASAIGLLVGANAAAYEALSFGLDHNLACCVAGAAVGGAVQIWLLLHAAAA